MNCLSNTTRQIIWNNEQLGIYKIRFFVVTKNRLYFYYVKKEKRSPKICIRLQAIKHRLCFQFIDPIRTFSMKIPCSVKSYHQFLCSIANSLILFLACLEVSIQLSHADNLGFAISGKHDCAPGTTKHSLKWHLPSSFLHATAGSDTATKNQDQFTWDILPIILYLFE